MIRAYENPLVSLIKASFFKPLDGGNSNIFGIFTPILGEDDPNLTNIFEMGWNHQLDQIPQKSLKNPLASERKHFFKTSMFIVFLLNFGWFLFLFFFGFGERLQDVFYGYIFIPDGSPWMGWWLVWDDCTAREIRGISMRFPSANPMKSYEGLRTRWPRFEATCRKINRKQTCFTNLFHLGFWCFFWWPCKIPFHVELKEFSSILGLVYLANSCNLLFHPPSLIMADADVDDQAGSRTSTVNVLVIDMCCVIASWTWHKVI